MSKFSQKSFQNCSSSSSNSSSSTPGTYRLNAAGGGLPQRTSTSKDGRENSPSQSPTVQLRRKTFMRRIGANRRISCKDLGHGDCKGWLLKKTEGGHSLRSKWVKRWFVLKDQNLYYYKDQEDLKAQGVVHLPGFQVSPAPEIKSKKYAFKAHHSGMTFYFASERQEDMGKWMNKMGLSAIVYDTQNVTTTAGFRRPESPNSAAIPEHPGYYSESDDDDSPSPVRKLPAMAQSKKDNDLSSKESLSTLFRTIQKADLGIDGSDMKNKRKSAITKPKKLQIRNSAELEIGRQLSSLQRTLKDKEQELEVLDGLLQTTHLDHETVQSFKSQHPEFLGHLHGKSTTARSHSDDDSS